MAKISVYFNTVRYLKAEQMWHQFTKKAKMACPLIKNHSFKLNSKSIWVIPAIKELDYDSDFLSRFSTEELLHNEVTLLHGREHLQLNGSWYFENQSPLWNHNLHYFEYLFALVNKYEESKDKAYLQKIKEYIGNWIKYNPIGSKNSAWECYPIALRIPNLIDIYSILQEDIKQDEKFRNMLIGSIFEQYIYLLNHLEKHLMANHYFEDLKALVISAVFFKDKVVQERATKELLEQCEEQIFDDGIHFERSPMYQKILLEDLIRVEVALECCGNVNKEIKRYISKMLDAAYSFENKLDRLPLFNDCGKNVSKSLSALISAANKYLGIEPKMKFSFPDSGFYIYEMGEEKEWKLLIDAGPPGPDNSPGHAHCEMMSYELFHNGKPVLVNCGTYAYQCNERQYFKSTKAHNTVRIFGTEQSECWSNFRMARRARLKDVHYNKQGIAICITDYLGHRIKRTFTIQDEKFYIKDESLGNKLESYIHFIDDNNLGMVNINNGKPKRFKALYSEEFGEQKEIPALKVSGTGIVCYVVKI